MHSNILIRWGGLSSLLSGAIGIAGEIALFITVGGLAYSDAAVITEWLVLSGIMAMSTILGMQGLVALFARQAQKTGKIGVVAFVSATFSTMMMFRHQWTGTFVTPVLAEGIPDLLDAISVDPTTIFAGGVFLIVFLMAAGLFLFGLVSSRAKILPSGSILLLMIGAILILGLSPLHFDLVVCQWLF